MSAGRPVMAGSRVLFAVTPGAGHDWIGRVTLTKSPPWRAIVRRERDGELFTVRREDIELFGGAK